MEKLHVNVMHGYPSELRLTVIEGYDILQMNASMILAQ